MVRERPNDQRGFVHKKILGLGGKLIGAVTGVPGVSLLPGSGFLKTAGQIFTGISRRTGPAQITGPSIIGLPPSSEFSGGRGGGERVPPDIRNVQESRARMRDANQVGGNGTCPTTCAPAKGNRRVNAAGECAPPGFHWNVSSYFRKGGACSRFEAGFVEEGTVLVKNRKLNNANGRAQDHALKRIERAQDHAKRMLRATGWRTISKQSSRELKMRRRSRH